VRLYYREHSLRKFRLLFHLSKIKKSILQIPRASAWRFGSTECPIKPFSKVCRIIVSEAKLLASGGFYVSAELLWYLHEGLEIAASRSDRPDG
jgi:hypothetical protein